MILHQNNLEKGVNKSAFSLVEVTIALALISYSLVALLALFVVGLNASKESSRETAFSQIAMHAASTYSGTGATATNNYTFEGRPTIATDPEKFFTVTYTSNSNTISNISTNFQLITIKVVGSGVTNVIQSSVYVP